MHIFYVDDDFEDREIFREAISEIGPAYVCNVASGGSEGMKFLEDMTAVPDYIFVDVNMPIMNGRQFLELLKNDPRLQDVPVIMYSTTSYSQERTEYFKLGARDVLVKPSTFDEICELLKGVINGPGLEVAATA